VTVCKGAIILLPVHGGLIARVTAALVASGAVAGGAVAGGAVGRATEPNSGIAGQVQEGPTCPVEQYPPSSRCAPRPLSAPIRIRAAAGGSHGLVVHSGSNGRFRVRLRAGRYVVTPERTNSSGFPRPPAPFRVDVAPGHFTHVTITYDTGIR